MRNARIAALLLSVLGAAGNLDAGPLRISLLADTAVTTDVIVLADLLPSGLSNEVRRRGEGVVLGKAPQPGSARVFARESIVAILGSSALAGMPFNVPPTMTVWRKTPALSRKIVWQSIQSAAARRGVALSKDASPDTLLWLPPESTEADETSFEVSDVMFDPLLKQARFRLQLAGYPQTPSFYVWCPVGGGNYGSTHSPTLQKAVHDEAEMVNPRRMATLQLHSRNSMATLQVRPLQAGSVGQIVRVRIPSNGHTLTARVLAANVLEAEF